MYTQLFLACVLLLAFVMVMAKRMNALVGAFRAQSFFLALITLIFGIETGNVELYIVALLLFSIKVIAIPYFLKRIRKKIKVDQSLGLYINPTLSLFIAMLLTYLSYLFAQRLEIPEQNGAFVISLSVMLIGLFIMVGRVKALTQIIGLLVMENGLFLAASAVSGGMPFFVEIAIFFDIFVCVIILGLFVYRINKLFTHIDVDKLRELKG